MHFFKGFIHFIFKGLYHLHKIGFKITFLCFSFVSTSGACCSRIAGLWWCRMALGLVTCVLMLSFRHLVSPGVGWGILMAAGLLRKAEGAVGQTMEVRGSDSSGSASSGPHWKGETVFQAGSSCPLPLTGFHGKTGSSLGPKGKPRARQWVGNKHG